MPRLAQQARGLDDEELGQPVGRVLLAAHEAERHGRAPEDRDEVQEAAHAAAGVAGEDHQRVGQQLVGERVVGHREAALGRAVAPALADRLERGERAGGRGSPAVRSSAA